MSECAFVLCDNYKTMVQMSHTTEFSTRHLGDNLSKFPVVNTDPGVTRQVLADHPDLMVVAFEFAKQGAEGKLHHHPHIQSTFVKSGKFVFTIDDKEFDVEPGDSFVVPTNAVHGCVCLEPGTLIDSFTPRRDDFL